jgi:hypothetical protein
MPDHNQPTEITQKQKDGMELLRRTSITGQKQSLAADLLTALKSLYEISGEANIPLTNSKSVRKMGAFLAARNRAKEVIERAERGRGI